MSRVIGWLLVLVLAASAVLGTVADHLGLTTTPPFAQLLAFRGVIGVGSLALALVLALIGSRGRRRRGRRAAVTFLAVVLLVTGLVHIGTLTSRGVVNAAPLTPGRDPATTTVLSLNTLDGASSPEAVADAALAADADVLALPETPVATARLVADLLAGRGMPMQVFTDDYGFRHRATSLLVRDSLGEYAATSEPTGEGFVRAEPTDGAGPTLVAVHVRRLGQVSAQDWAAGLERAVQTCRSTPGAVVAGDFNATLDHGPMRRLGRCVDAAAAGGPAGAGAYGTWHAAIPALLGAPIDHVLADGERWTVTEVGVVDVGDSDHRAVLARLAPRSGG